jgi:hypothetical protein
MKSLLYYFKNNFIPLLFTILGIELIFYSLYKQFDIVNTVVIAVMVIILYLFYRRVNAADKKGQLLYILVAIIIFFLSFICIKASGISSSVSFLESLFKGGKVISVFWGYRVATILLITFIFSSMFNYYTVKIIRMPVLLLLFFVVMILYIKGPYQANNIAVYAFVLSFILLFIESAKQKNKQKFSKINVKTKDLAVLSIILVGFIFSIAMFTPMIKMPTLGPLENIKSYFQNYISGDNKGFSVDKNTSRSTDETITNNPDKVIYKIRAKTNPEYLIMHNFDQYKEGKWVQENQDFLYGSETYFGNSILLMSTKASLKSLTQKEISDFEGTLTSEISKKRFEELFSAKDIDNKEVMSIKPVYSENEQIAHPSKIYSVIGQNDKIYLNGFDELFKTQGNKFMLNNAYVFSYTIDTPAVDTADYQIMTFFNEERYKALIKNDDIFDYYDIKKSYTHLEDSTSKDFYNLSEDLTKNKESTYDKAKAIEDYFKSGEYTYNLTLPANDGKDDYINYFLFKGKKGYCIQFATAMTLLCRATDIPARYVEGYVIDNSIDKTSDGGYDVNACRAHAFVEVYIPGYGWKIFDPTPGIVESPQTVEPDNNQSAGDSSNDSKSIIIKILFVAFIVIILSVIIFIILKLTSRTRRINKFLRLSNEEALERIINYTISMLKKGAIEPKKGETSLNFAVRVDRDIDVGFESIVRSYYSYKYGMGKVSKGEVEEAVNVNNKVYQYLTKSRK